ncbi:hypothetical protein [Duganella sp. FT27W]|uniref:hypothetical protein n=1 Tax=Duganella sp. FT27W TaxID=2654636 RepID=UPI00128E1299|nr:hypothetical protein [Duganella sp. FT27W]MPQ56282.1 hypothetical protein [Duganella sp. FT27W]
MNVKILILEHMDIQEIQLPVDEERQRRSIDLSVESWEELAVLAKAHKITQGEVVDLMLVLLRGSDSASALYDRKRAAKVAARAPKKQLNALLRTLTPEQIAAAVELASKGTT